jgi:transcriptional regulator with XRE-family HTH domain
VIDQLLNKIGKRIRDLRKHQGLTQEQLAEKSGLSYKYLGEIERGEKNSGILNLFRIAEGLSLPIGDIIINIETEPHTEERKLKDEIMGFLSDKNSNDLKKTLKVLKAVFE